MLIGRDVCLLEQKDPQLTLACESRGAKRAPPRPRFQLETKHVFFYGDSLKGCRPGGGAASVKLQLPPSQVELLRASRSFSERLRASQNFSELVRASQSFSELLRASRSFSERFSIGFPWSPLDPPLNSPLIFLFFMRHL